MSISTRQQNPPPRGSCPPPPPAPPPKGGSSFSASGRNAVPINGTGEDRELRVRCLEAVLAGGGFDLEVTTTSKIIERAKQLHQWVIARD